MKWDFLVIADLLMTLAAWALAPFLPAFASVTLGPCDNATTQANEPRLPSWLSWFQTPDNSLLGDGAWKRMEPGHWPWRASLASWPRLQFYVGAVGWLWRNAAYGFAAAILGARIQPGAVVTFDGDPLTQNSPNFWPGYCHTVITNPDGSQYWHRYYVYAINSRYCWNLNFGWKLKTYAEDPERVNTEPRAMFCFSPRITGYTLEA